METFLLNPQKNIPHVLFDAVSFKSFLNKEQPIENNLISFAKSITDPYKMLFYIEISIAYIDACKMSISIHKILLEMKRISKDEFKKAVQETLRKIIYESEAIYVYTSSASYKKEFLQLRPDKISEGMVDENSSSEQVEMRVAKLINEVKEILKDEHHLCI